MKKCYLISLCLFLSMLLVKELRSQSPCPLNGANGNPISTNPVPYVPGQSFKINTWDWTAQFQNASNTNYSGYNPLTNFYYRPNLPYSQHLAKGSASDFYNVDGWELIKRDFGYLADGSHNPVSAPGPYYVLYNKYSGILRILAALPGLGANQTINVKISFKAADPSNPNQANLKTSGLFNSYNVSCSAMDKAGITNATTPAVYPGFDYEFFYADFQTNYDPCTCVFESALQVEFATVNQMDVVLSGNLLGIVDPIATYSNGTVSLDQNNDFLASVYRNASGYATSGMLMYKTIDDMVNDYQRSMANANYGSFGDWLGDLNYFATILKNGADVVNDVANLDPKFKAFETIAKVTTLFTSALKKNSSPAAPPMPSVIHAQMALKGQITDQRALPGATFNFANPGSLNAANKPEYNDGVAPRPVPPSVDYPMYNEALGIFALLESPKVVFTSYYDYNADLAYCDNSGDITSYGYKYRLLFKLSEPLKYVFNPAVNVDEAKTEIKAAWMYTHRSLFDNLHSYNPCDIMTFVNMSRVEKVYNQGAPRYPSFMTPFLPLNYFTEYKAGLDLFERQVYGGYVDGQDQYFLPVPHIVAHTNYPQEDNENTDSLYLKVLIKLVSKNLDPAGKPIVTMLEYTYQVPPENATLLPNQNLGASNYVEAPESITLNAQNFTASITIRAYGTVYINGNLTANPGVTVNIYAGENIILASGVTTGSGIILHPATQFISPGASYGAQTSGDVTSFCGGSKYKANTPASNVFIPNNMTGNAAPLTPVAGADTINSLKIFEPWPNPVISGSNLKIRNDKAQAFTIYVTDLSGKTLKTVAADRWLDKGTYDFPIPFDANTPAGYYLVTVRWAGGVVTKKLIKQ